MCEHSLASEKISYSSCYHCKRDRYFIRRTDKFDYEIKTKTNL